jgi:hypothetical protein
MVKLNPVGGQFCDSVPVTPGAGADPAFALLSFLLWDWGRTKIRDIADWATDLLSSIIIPRGM